VTATATEARRLGRPARIGAALASYLGFAPAIVLLGLFFLVPLGIIVCYSFWETYNYAVVHHWTFDNYHYFFTVPTYVSTMWATLWVSVLATAIAIGLAFPFAYWL
jgi:spermidine/putrescine transport system permease protein